MPNIKKQIHNDAEFLAMLAHDMKTPVSAQIRAINLLYSGLFGEFSNEAKNIMLNIIASNKYLQNLLENVLDNYRINNGIFILNKDIKDIRYTIEQALLNVGILSEIKNQKVVISCASNNLSAYYDEIEMQRVIINILSNAFKYAKEFSTVLISAQKSCGQIKVSIESEINADINPSSLQNKSTGFGLNICKKILKAHKGIFEHYTDKNKYIAAFEFPAV